MTVAGLNFNLLSERGEGYRALSGTVTVPSVAYAGVTKVCMPLWLPRTGVRDDRVTVECTDGDFDHSLLARLGLPVVSSSPTA